MKIDLFELGSRIEVSIAKINEKECFRNIFGILVKITKKLRNRILVKFKIKTIHSVRENDQRKIYFQLIAFACTPSKIVPK